MGDGQEDSLARAEAAAAAGDGWGTVEALLQGPVLDGLVRRLQAKWPKLPHADMDEAVSAAVDDLYTAVRHRRIGSLVAWLFKVADRKAGRLHDRQAKEQLRNPADMAEDPRLVTSVEDLEAPSTADEQAVAAEVVAIARSLLRQFPTGNTVRVMEVYINAAELGVSHLDHAEVAAIVGLAPDTVRVLTGRGFRRMERLARESSLVNPTFGLSDLLDDAGTDADHPHDDGGDDDERR